MRRFLTKTRFSSILQFYAPALRQEAEEEEEEKEGEKEEEEEGEEE